MKRQIVYSIIIVNFNGSELICNCITSIFKSNFHHLEIIVVDNGSSDNSLNALTHLSRSSPFPLKIIRLKQNYGPAKARNRGAKIAKGKYLGFLDNDTEVDKNWILEADKIFKKKSRIGSIQCKLLQLNNKNRFDYLGEHLSNFGFLVPLVPYGTIDNGQQPPFQNTLAAKSAGMFIRKKIFQKIKGFDEKYFIFLEETDLGWRVWLNNYQVVTCPSSIVYHRFSSTKNIVDPDFNNYLVRFHGTKNYIYTLIKNLSVNNLIKILPIHLILWLGFSGYLLINRNFDSSLNVLKGIFWNIFNLSNILAKRQYTQSHRLISDQVLFNQYNLMAYQPLSFFIKRFKKSQQEIRTPENQNAH